MNLSFLDIKKIRKENDKNQYAFLMQYPAFAFVTTTYSMS